MENLCANKNMCGSCDWSLKPYEEQLKEKLSMLTTALSGYLPNEALEIIGSPKIVHYRNRMDFVIDFERRVGLREKGKWWRVLDGHTCFISMEQVEEVFHIIRTWVQSTKLSCYDRKKFHGFLRYAVIRATLDGATMVNIVTSTPLDSLEEDLARQDFSKLASLLKDSTVLWSINNTASDTSFGDTIHIISGKGYLEETINGLVYKISPNAFFQTNSYCSPLLQNVVIDYIKSKNPTNVLDLYCGTGFFTLPISNFAKVLGVELVEDAIKDAKFNSDKNKLNASFRAEKAEDLTWVNEDFDLMIVDPPRIGLYKTVLEAILTKSPNNIVYVSCNFQSLAKELPRFIEKYKVVKVKAVDMFPHTPHVETICFLEKK